MMEKLFWETGSVIIGLMGLLHMRGTFYKDKLHPRNEELIEDMKGSSVLLTDKLNMWKSWIGFNATHSSGAAFIGIINFYLAFRHFELLQSDPLLPLFTIITLGYYVWVAIKYWFNVIAIMLTISWVCFIAAYVLMLI